MSATLTRPMTADELLAMPDDGLRYELVKGELLMSPPPGSEHGEIGMNLAAPLYQHVKNNHLGVVFAAETGFKLESDPDTVRAPDIAFLRKDRVEQTGRIPGYHSGASLEPLLYLRFNFSTSVAGTQNFDDKVGRP